jgi:hypothetical protein
VLHRYKKFIYFEKAVKIDLIHFGFDTLKTGSDRYRGAIGGKTSKTEVLP